LPIWAQNSGADSVVAHTSSGVAAGFDAVTGASPKFSSSLADTTIAVTWDLRDTSGVLVPDGEYRFCAEVSNIQKDSAGTSFALSTTTETTCGTATVRGGAVVSAPATAHIEALSAQWTR
jgi:flagellar hook assembly protein FlgD